METTVVFDSYWRFAAERLAMYLRRLEDARGPWTEDMILRAYRFTNTFRATDRVSQYLIREVQYNNDRSQAPDEVFYRTLLFKLFNRIETWELLEEVLGGLSWQSADLSAISDVLGNAMQSGRRVYSAAYIMPAPPFGYSRKHDNHLALLELMMTDGLPARISQARSLAEVYKLLRAYPGLGSFLAFQYTVDLNYSSMIDFDESSFVVAGPGAIDGIAKCFPGSPIKDAEAIIERVTDEQEAHFTRLGLCFDGLFGRRLQPIDCQNLFCEISKYARVAHPEIAGLSGRTRIKQSYVASGCLPPPVFPPSWQLKPPSSTRDAAASPEALVRQGVLF